ncbi:MAG: nicotinate (nicotinamide) nucleotide adenylyltransferase [Candidatus Omnitrophica bacterium]|nr:nicotinate (nicotinamide) nucleotide adenylyltransferase [Candidatus Omnitrophota bacterium]
MKIGIFGGTFNPVHLGHLLLAEGARERLKLDLVLWVPARLPPHKSVSGEVSSEERCRMVELAIEGHPAFRLSRVELNRTGPSYAIDTIRELQSQFPGKKTEWVFLVGSDTARELPTWKQIGELMTLIQFAAVPRPRGGTFRPHLSRLPERRRISALPAAVEEIPVKTPDISSSEIRQRLREGRSIRYWVPEAVRLHIEEGDLYR